MENRAGGSDEVVQTKRGNLADKISLIDDSCVKSVKGSTPVSYRSFPAYTVKQTPSPFRLIREK